MGSRGQFAARAGIDAGRAIDGRGSPRRPTRSPLATHGPCRRPRIDTPLSTIRAIGGLMTAAAASGWGFSPARSAGVPGNDGALRRRRNRDRPDRQRGREVNEFIERDLGRKAGRRRHRRGHEQQPAAGAGARRRRRPPLPSISRPGQGCPPAGRFVTQFALAQRDQLAAGDRRHPRLSAVGLRDPAANRGTAGQRPKPASPPYPSCRGDDRASRW